ncbi:hypothetical protein [Leifsonia aquatica]|uniref:hypothetical protein n=1 Tax=Leifsonia aquatica TaxID=144185 RepID=UPI0037F2E183
MGAIASVATIAVVGSSSPVTSAALHDNAYLNLTGSAGKPMGTLAYDLEFRYRTAGDWNSGTAGMSDWMQADADGGIDVTDAVNCRTPLPVASRWDDASACHAEIHVRNMSPALASTLAVSVEAAPGSDAGMARAVRYALYSAFPTNRIIYYSNIQLDATTTMVDPDRRGQPPLTVKGTSTDWGRLEFAFFLLDQGAAANAALAGKSLGLHIKLHGRSVVVTP